MVRTVRPSLAVAALAALAGSILVAACGGSTKTGGPDAAAVDATGPDAFASTCGMPGDVGNELGVGKFCATLNDCLDTPDAKLCSNIGDATTFFCTKLCSADAGAPACGTGAQCVCDSGGSSCGCTPTVCL